jgi:hypothetical protein
VIWYLDYLVNNIKLYARNITLLIIISLHRRDKRIFCAYDSVPARPLAGFFKTFFWLLMLASACPLVRLTPAFLPLPTYMPAALPHPAILPGGHTQVE